jgi:hypothetical protein
MGPRLCIRGWLCPTIVENVLAAIGVDVGIRGCAALGVCYFVCLRGE